MQSVRVRACGKVNLSLNITGRREGLHTLDSVTASVDLCDEIVAHRTNDGALRLAFEPVTGGPTRAECDAIPADCSVTRAYAALRQVVPALGLCVTVKKRIPIAGGLGGSSADAAGLLAAIRALYPQVTEADVQCAAAKAGSDVPVMFAGGYARLRGVGDEVTRFDAPALHLAVLRPAGSVQTPEAYRLFDTLYPRGTYCPADNDALIVALQGGDSAGVGAQLQNALLPSAKRLCPHVTAALELLASAGGVPFLTGSGNCCCGLFPSKEEAQRAVRDLQNAQDGMQVFYASTTKQGCFVA